MDFLMYLELPQPKTDLIIDFKIFIIFVWLFQQLLYPFPLVSTYNYETQPS